MMYLGSNAVGLATSIPSFADIAKIECGNYTPTTDEDVADTWISHSLGVMPDFVLFVANNFTLTTASATKYLESGAIYKSAAIASMYSEYEVNSRYILQYSKSNSITELASSGGMVIIENQISASGHDGAAEFRFPKLTSGGPILKANVTYHYVIGKFKEVTNNA